MCPACACETSLFFQGRERADRRRIKESRGEGKRCGAAER